MLGKGWFPDHLGGLERYYRDLFEHLPEVEGVVLGPVAVAPPNLHVVSAHAAPLHRRLLAIHRQAAARAGAIDVVDAHFALYALLPTMVGPLRRTPLVVHFQGPWAQENVAQGDSSALRAGARRLLERAVYGRAHAVITLTGAFKRVLIERYRVSPWDVHVLAPGVDLQRFSPGDQVRARERFGLASDAWVVGCVRRLVPRMGLDVLLDAWEQARGDLPPGATLLIAGDGPLRTELEARAAAPGLGGSVRVLGRVAEDELVELYRAAALTVVPTRSFEGFGLVVLEAAGCGTPSVVTAIGGLPEAVRGLGRDLVVAPGDAAALARRLVAAGHGDLPARSATRAFAERFDWAAVAARHAEVYRSVCEGAAAPGPAASAPRRLRVVYLDHVAKLSGGEIALLRLLPHLEEVQPHVILAEDGPFADRLVQAGISTEVLPLGDHARELRKDRVAPGRVPLRAGLATSVYVLRLAWRLRRLRPDVVHTNSLKAGLYGSVAARLAGVPVVWHVRDRIAADYLPGPTARLLRTLIRRLPDQVVVNSEATLATLGPPDARGAPVSVLPEVLEDGSRAYGRPGHDPTVFGMVGRLTPWKGQDLFLRSFAAAFDGGRERARIVGSAMFGEEGYAHELRVLADELGIADRVEFRGFREDVGPELAAMHVLVHASRTPEPFGQVVLEGMAAGLAVVASDAGGPAELLQNGTTGRLFAIGEGDQLTRVLRELAGDPSQRDRLGAAARAASARYDPAAVAAQMTDVYRQALRCRQPGASSNATSSSPPGRCAPGRRLRRPVAGTSDTRYP